MHTKQSTLLGLINKKEGKDTGREKGRREEKKEGGEGGQGGAEGKKRKSGGGGGFVDCLSEPSQCQREGKSISLACSFLIRKQERISGSYQGFRPG
jgi:hypothetical protein